MIRFENTKVFNFDGAIRGMRNPLNSWDKSDSYYNPTDGEFILGKNDLDLAQRLAKAGSDHRKFMRQILICVDITAPLYWWKEFDTYKVGTVANSTSTMHKITSKEITFDDFSFSETENPYMKNFYNKAVESCERLREDYLECMAEAERYTDPMMKEEARSHAKEYWNALIKILPCAYNQKRTVTLNYENLVNMYHSRRSHKLEEWHNLCSWVESLPNSNLILLAAGVKE